ncbi:GNAT family N-acetyltransferase [Tissierella sp. MSJ-40]|uniref:GNAT family N-acetyltransferase n=1 Tax=Tissierella simiarum TaxID=2841534 RepID=A0ABS6E2L3_9FIRM|nr:GNAT family N-acetyltransferase [Tissierella simiarum]
MVQPTDGKNFYCLVYSLEDEPVGEVSFHRYNEITKTAEFNVKILSKYRGRGYAKEATILLLDYYFNEFFGEVMLDSIAISNNNGQKTLLNIGFEHRSSTDGVSLVSIDKEKYNESYKK